MYGRSQVSEVTNLVEAHTWLAVLAEARCSRARVTKGTLAEATMVPDMLAMLPWCGRHLMKFLVAKQTNIRDQQLT